MQRKKPKQHEKNENDDVCVKHYAENEVGQHLAKMFDEDSTLDDVCRADKPTREH